MSVYFFIYKTKFKTFQIIYIKYPIKKEIKYIFDILFHLFIGKIFVRNYTHILMKIINNAKSSGETVRIFIFHKLILPT